MRYFMFKLFNVFQFHKKQGFINNSMCHPVTFIKWIDYLRKSGCRSTACSNTKENINPLVAKSAEMNKLLGVDSTLIPVNLIG